MGEAKRKKMFKEEIDHKIMQWKEVNKVMGLKIIFAGNATLIGEYEDGILNKPRAIAIGTDAQGRGGDGTSAFHR